MPSAPLVPAGDPTLLFTSAGMVQFKPYFMGQAKAPHSRLVSVQKCFRTTDIESVGDFSHLTFFEMLGNFSIADYFKSEVIPWAWEFYTEVLKFNPDRLWTAVYLDDDEAHDAWRSIGVPPQRIKRYGEDHNYWFSGEIGPCGPCSEIHYDFGEQFGCGPACEPSHDCGRFVEIWNLVFMSFYCDGEKRTPLPSKNVDTGAGLERNACVLLYESDEWPAKNKKPTVYDTDLFRPIIAKVEELSGKQYGDNEATDRAIRIVAEHARAVTFLVGDERTPVTPSNEERGYVVRRMLRRAAYFGRQLGIDAPFLAGLASAVIDSMAPSYGELQRQRSFITDIIGPEERRFNDTLIRGIDMLNGTLERAGDRSMVSGIDAFKLHDTYGFPIELTREIAAARGFTVDEAGFQAEMERQKQRARSAAGTTEALAADARFSSLANGPTKFTGFTSLDDPRAVLVAVNEPDAGCVEVLLTQTPFYPEGGGQVGDRGEITGPNGRLVVDDTQRVDRFIVHHVRVVEGRIAVGETVTARVDPQHRADTMRNHTATHLLHAALRQVLGTTVRQAGSLVAPDRLRFDFTHTQAVSQEDLEQVERLVNHKVRQNLPVHSRTTTFDQAMSEGVLAFFGEKYGQDVRVVEVNTVAPRFSAELCGGTHCQRTGDIGAILVTGELSIGAGMRRIEALTGRGAEEYVRQQSSEFTQLAHRLGTSRAGAIAKADALVAELDTMRKRVEKLERSLASAAATNRTLGEPAQVEGVPVLVQVVDAPSLDALRYTGDAARKAVPSGVIVIASVIEGRPHFIAMVSPDIVTRGPKAGEILKQVTSITGGGGGGRPDMAQGGGKDAAKIDAALAIVPDAVRRMLSDGT